MKRETAKKIISFIQAEEAFKTHQLTSYEEKAKKLKKELYKEAKEVLNKKQEQNKLF